MPLNKRPKFLAKFLIAAFLLVPNDTLFAANSVIKQRIPNIDIVGSGRLTKFVWDVYDATLYAPEGEWSERKPFILSIQYLREIDGLDIADRSVQEIRQQGFNDEVILAAWHEQMRNIFPDVQNGTVLTALFIPKYGTEFFKDNKPIGKIKGDDFLYWFSSIWLSEKTSEPALRQRLLGMSTYE